ncbi:MAG TPA: tripartite tricarboxylate transporter TctB family protein [Rectinemataceae bacterium]
MKSPGSRKTVPIAMLVFSLAYFPYILSQGNSKMIGDEIGGDPGGFLLPAFLAGFMLLGAIYLLFADKIPVGDESAPKAGAKFYFAIGSGILYILLFSKLGFIVASTLLVYSLSFIASLDTPIRKNLIPLFAGIATTLAFTVGCYSAGRFITRYLFQIGRTTSFTIASAPFFVFSANILAIGLILLAASQIVHRMKPGTVSRTVMSLGLVTAGSVEFLFLVFRQLFLVNLARGVISW